MARVARSATLRRALAAAALLVAALFVPRLVAPTVPRVTGFRKITTDRAYKRWPVTDGARTYFTESLQADISSVMQVSANGSDVAPISIALPSSLPMLDDLSPDGSELLVLAPREPVGTGHRPKEVWVVPVVGGAPRRLGDLQATSAMWSRDGQTLAYSDGPDLSIASRDGGGGRRIWTAPGPVLLAGWSPDGLTLSATVEQSGHERLWQVSADGKEARPLVPDMEAATCCGRFTPDGRWLVFEAYDERGSDLWVMRAHPSWRGPGATRLTHGPLNFHDPVSRPDGRGLFAVGEQVRGELVRYEPRLMQFIPYLGGISAEGVDFSRDGQWLAYVTFPEGTLWRRRQDGSEALQLTFAPVSTALPRWSPDGSRLAFTETTATQKPTVRVIGSNGGPSQKVLNDERSQVDATWSPDGAELAVGLAIAEQRDDRPIDIRVVSLGTGAASVVPGSESLFSPRWSPDGRWLAALTCDSLRLLLYDFSARQWRTLLRGRQVLTYPDWSRDGRYLFVNEGSSCLRLNPGQPARDVIARFDGLQRATGAFGEWAGHAPDGAVLALRDIGGREIFALDWEIGRSLDRR